MVLCEYLILWSSNTRREVPSRLDQFVDQLSKLIISTTNSANRDAYGHQYYKNVIP